VYFVDFDTLSGRNVVVATEVGGELLVLDRELKKWNDYFNTVSPLYDLRVFKILLNHEADQKYQKYKELCESLRDLRPQYHGRGCDPQTLKRRVSGAYLEEYCRIDKDKIASKQCNPLCMCR